MTFVDEQRPAPGIVRLTMRQAGKKNAMNAAMRETLSERIAVCAAAPDVDALILTGADGQFSAGGDLQGLMRVQKSEFRQYLKRGHDLVLRLWNFEKPTVAAIEGVGVGGGLALAMCCDQIVIGRSARIGFTFLKIGFVPDWGSLFTVVQRVGPACARELFLGAELIDASQALAIGLVDRLVDDEAVQATSLDLAQQLARQPKRAYAFTKRFLQNLPATLEQALEFEVMVQENCFKSEDFLAGVAPFLDKERN
ncbi:MAG: enoyl-CoA hydratase/isomerase family protein [Betaproteobacteria bacterium]